MAYNNDNHDGNTHETEYCVMCRRPDSAAGRMIHLPGHLCVCSDCMQKMMDFAGKMDFTGITGNSSATQNLFDMFRNVPETGDPCSQNNVKDTSAPYSAKDVSGDKAEGVMDDSQSVHNTGDTEEPDVVVTQEDEEEKEEGKEERKGPSISFLNLGDIFGNGGGFGQTGPRVKKKKKNTRKPVFSIDNIPAPHKIKEELDKYVIGQERAKKLISVAAYNHYKRVRTNTMDEIEIEKSNILLIGPTGCGKTYLVRTLAEMLDVPLAISDATSLTEAGYIGDDIESVISKLLAAADNDIEKAEKGIVFIDEIDKIAKKKNTNSRDVSGESVQQGLLKILEGAEIEVPVGASSKNAMVPLTTVNTRNILFICGGAFPNLETIIRERLQKQTSMGFGAQLKDHYDKDKNILDKVTNEDLRRFGMIPEFIGRLPITCVLQGLDTDMLVRILREPKNAILKQYQKLLALDEVDLRFEDDALEAIAARALERDTGARALRSVIEDFMTDIMYEIPKDDNIGTVTITRAFVEGKGGPLIGIRTDTTAQIGMSHGDEV